MNKAVVAVGAVVVLDGLAAAAPQPAHSPAVVLADAEGDVARDDHTRHLRDGAGHPIRRGQRASPHALATLLRREMGIVVILSRSSFNATQLPGML